MEKNYRIPLLIMFLWLAAMIVLLTQPFFKWGGEVEVSGIDMIMTLPFKFMGEDIPESIAKMSVDQEWVLAPITLLYALTGEMSAGLIFTYILSGILLLTTVVILLSALTALFRVLFNKPYGHGRIRYLVLLFLNLLGVGLCFASTKIDAINNMLITETGFPGVYDAALFYFIFTGGMLVLYIMSRISSKKRI